MALVEIADVSLPDLDTEQLWGRRIDFPKPGSQTDRHAINIRGWVLGRNSPAVAVELVHEGTVVRRVPLNVRRPDIAASFTDVDDAEMSGFQTMVGTLGMAPEFDLCVQAILKDDSRIGLGVIRGRHQTVHSVFEPILWPLMVTSLGRTGTTWLMRVLAEHPQIVAYRHYPYELRAAKYWMHMLKVLAEPANHFQSANLDNFHVSSWWVGHNPFYSRPIVDCPQLDYWFGRTYVERLAAFCEKNVEEFYQQVASSQHKAEPIYFAEKHIPDNIPWLIWELYPRAGEIFLVRDFRDMVCSMLTFNARRGYEAFGRENVGSDEDFVRRLRHHALSLLRAWRRRASKAHLLRYEDLILRPVESLGGVLEYLELDSTPETVESMIRRASDETPDIRHHQTSPAPERSIGRWKHDLDASLQAVCQEAFSDVLEEFGYE